MLCYSELGEASVATIQHLCRLSGKLGIREMKAKHYVI